jgi:dTDP-4-dehydrorhamnose reductase
MKKIVILGSAGMLGHMVYHYLLSKNKFEIIDASFPVKANEKSILLNVTEKDAVEKYIRTEKPDILINCIGILIKGSMQEPSNAIYLNSFFPHQLSKILSETGGKLIHISTDCVFSGKDGNYNDTSFRDADDVYGRSKALGEINSPDHLTIRTSIVGPELKTNGEGLFHWFMLQQGEITGFTNVFWGGVTTLELAKAIEYCIDNSSVAGLIHLTNGEKISKFDLLKLFKSVWKSNHLIIKEGYGKKGIDKSLAKSESFGFIVPSYSEMLGELNIWMRNHRNLYSQYKF